jgi:hypothetical protein
MIVHVILPDYMQSLIAQFWYFYVEVYLSIISSSIKERLSPLHKLNMVKIKLGIKRNGLSKQFISTPHFVGRGGIRIDLVLLVHC